jgi:predicted AAA+ superfamily ATPase
MENLIQRFYEKYAQTNTKLVRDFISKVDWSNRFIGIKGSRGVGKTTLLLQYIKLNYKPDNKVLYTSLDSLYFTENHLYDLAEAFYKKGGELLVLDEVHRYSDWSVELKNIYDDFPNLKVVFTGSSLLQISKANADLSRRAVMYEMPGLSFREFLIFENVIKLPSLTIQDIFENHTQLAIDIISQIKPLAHFSNYLNYGYYPFYLENPKSFHQKLFEAIQVTLEIDIPQFESIQTSNIIYLRKLLQIISASVPFKPNMNTISQRTGISLNTMKLYLKYLADANLISLLYFEEKGINSLNKPEKVYLQNTNLMHSLAPGNTETGHIRETFFLSQVSVTSKVNASYQADFLLENKYTIEIGGKSKTQHQIAGVENAFIVKDNIEVGNDNIVPLWLFGFLY